MTDPRNLCRALHTVGTMLDKRDPLRIAAHYRFDREWIAGGKTTTGLTERLGVNVREAQRLVVLYRGPQR